MISPFYSPPPLPDPKETLGAKAFSLVVMRELGIPVPSGFVLSTSLEGEDDPIRVLGSVRLLGDYEGCVWGGTSNPLLVSCRSGAAVSMPGMMETIPNLGLTEEIVKALLAGDNAPEGERFVLDCFRRLLESYGPACCGIPRQEFVEVHQAAEQFYGTLTNQALHVVVRNYLRIYTEHSTPFPESVDDQLMAAVAAVRRSWHSPEAVVYRGKMGIPHNIGGTAVIIQKMVFGNRQTASGTGVALSHNPHTGEREMVGEYLPCAQGHDIVSGEVTPEGLSSLKTRLPNQYALLEGVCEDLFQSFDHPVEVEFTLEDGRLWILQCREAQASVNPLHATLARLSAGELTVEEAFAMITGGSETEGIDELRGVGTGASQGIGQGRLAVTEEDVSLYLESGEAYIFAAATTSTADTAAMSKAAGLLTAAGGQVSHAAVVARSWSIPAVVSLPFRVSDDGIVLSDDTVITRGTLVRINGTTGELFTA